jgi:hypothetical protein
MEQPEQRRISHAVLLFTFAPLVIFAAIYATGRYEWAARNIAFDRCDIRLTEILSATAATLNIVICLQWFIAALSIALALPRRIVVPLIVVNALMLGVMHAYVIPKLFGFAWAESVQSCSVHRVPYVKLALSSVIACVTFGITFTYAWVTVVIVRSNRK